MASLHRHRIKGALGAFGSIRNSPYNLVMRVIAIGVLACSVLLPRVHAQDSTTELRSLYDSHRWFELRDAVTRTDSPKFYAGAVAAAFNQVPKAERNLQFVIAHDPSGDSGLEARELLLALFYRTGNYHGALAEAKALLRQKPSATDIVNILPTLQVLSVYGSQSVGKRRPGTMKIDVEDENLVLPVTVNGISGHYIFDNGFSLSGISESEAQRLRLDIHDVATNIDSMSGTQVKTRIAVADSLVVAGVRLQNVAFYVLPDDKPPFNQLSTGRRGILGLPVILALGHFRWSARDLTFTVLPTSGAVQESKANIAFDGTGTLCRPLFDGKPIDFSLDTGAQNTVLYPSFGDSFPAVKAAGLPENHQVTGVGGSIHIDSISIPSLTLTVGGRPVVLKPAHLLLHDNNSTSNRFAGNLGMDLLNQARDVEIDFQSMTLTLH